jgi:branched-chain amino acid transport system substrate-binding protein
MMTMRFGTIALAGAALALALGTSDARAADDTIVLGAAISQTGKFSVSGTHTANGYDIAVEKINAMGGVKVGDKSYKLEVKYYDDESEAARALYNNGNKYTIATLSTSDQYLSSAVDLAAEKAQEAGKDPKTVRLGLAMGDDVFSQDVRAGIVDAAKKYGMELVIDDKLPDAFTDMSATLTKVKALKPDLLLISGHEKGALTAAKQIKEQKVAVPMVAMTHCDSADIIGQVGEAAEYTLCASQWAPQLTYKDGWFGSAADYSKAFAVKYGHEPPYQAAESTAAVLVYADAFARAGSLEIDKVRDAIAATELDTFYGRIDFDDTGKNIAKPMVLLQVLKGKYEVVGPTKWATEKVVYPRPAG